MVPTLVMESLQICVGGWWVSNIGYGGFDQVCYLDTLSKIFEPKTITTPT